MSNSAALTKPGRNGGTLLAGGVWGNKGGTGRPPSEVAKASKDGYEAVLKLMERLVTLVNNGDDEKLISTSPMLIQLLDKLGKYGVGEAKIEAPQAIEGFKQVWGEFLDAFPVGTVVKEGDRELWMERMRELMKSAM